MTKILGDSEARPPHVPRRSIADRFGAIFDAVNDGIFISDPATGQFMEINAPGCRMFGYTKAELVGANIGTLSSNIHPYTLAMAFENVKNVMQGKNQMFEWQCRTKSGALFWTEVSVAYTEIGNIPAIIAIVRDITERKRLDGELKHALQNASSANEAKTTFLASMSHELRTPLNAIIGFSDVMLSEIFGPMENPRYRNYIDNVHDSGLQLLALIDDLLDLSRIDAGKADLTETEVGLQDAVENARRLLELQAKQSGVKLVVNIPAALPDIRGDERRIRQIVLNLLSNAIKFTLKGGVVTVQGKQSPNGLLLKIIDTGIGIAAEDLPKVLERFGQVDSAHARKHKGTGLGLPLVKELIELHGGSLTLASEVGVGTTVIVTFPKTRIVNAAARATG